MSDNGSRWSIIHDNETNKDLLNYKPIVDTIKNIIINGDDEPITIGIHGDWGAGKSSVLKMLESSFNSESSILYVTFNGWLYQEFEDAKIAILEKLIDSIKSTKESEDNIKEKARKLLKRVDWLKASKLTLKYGVPIAGTLLTGVPIPPIISSFIKTEGEKEKSTDDIIKALEEAGTLLKAPDNKKQITTQIESFRKEFAELLFEAKIEHLVILVDDLDRCLPSTVVEILEAIRLFLFIPKAAFVIAADQSMIQYSVSQHYPQISNISGMPSRASEYSKNYLEKLVQVPFILPSLGHLATKVYVLLLMLQSAGIMESSDFESLKNLLHGKLRIPWEGNKIDFKTISEAISFKDEKADVFKECLFVADQVFNLLAEATKGNPRQVKRFINTLLLYLQIAEAMGLGKEVSIKPLAKLMLLERFKQEAWIKISQECMCNHEGRSQLIVALEEESKCEIANDISKLGKKPIISEQTDEHLKSLFVDPWFNSWTKLEPMLSEMDLRPYFLVAQDIRLPAFTKTVTPRLAELARKLMSSEMEAAGAKDDIEKLTPDETSNLFEAMKSEFHSVSSLDDEPPALKGLSLLVRAKPELFPQFIVILNGLPLERANAWSASTLMRACPSQPPPEAIQTMSAWAEQTSHHFLKTQAKAYLRQLKK